MEDGPPDQSSSSSSSSLPPPAFPSAYPNKSPNLSSMSNDEFHVSQIESKANPVSSYSVVDGEMDNKFAMYDNKSVTETDKYGNVKPPSEYNSLANEEKIRAKIIAKTSLDQDDAVAPFPSSCHKRNVSVDQLTNKVPNNNQFGRTQSTQNRFNGQETGDKAQIDTATPFRSVKAAVSKFGGIVDWKAHRVQTVERRKFIEQELEKAQEEIPSCKQQCEVAEEAKKQVMKEVENTRRLIEELKLNLERAQTEERQAKQDSELAELRVEELEQGIGDEEGFAAKAQLEVAKARHEAAVTELKTVKDELEQIKKDYALLLSEKEAAEAKAEEAVASSKEVEKSVEDLMIELLQVKQSLESAHAAHLEAEEHRVAAVMAKEQETQNWEKELRQADEELENLNQRMLSTKEMKSKLGVATALLNDLKSELATYMESKSEETGTDPEKRTRADIRATIAVAKEELVEVRINIEKTNDEVDILKVAASSLKSDLEKENAELAVAQQREGMAAITIGSLEAELNRMKSELAEVHMKEKEERERMGDLPTRLQKAAHEADLAKAMVQKARKQLGRAKEEAEQAKAGAATRESRFRAVQKEIEAARASEQLALAAITALQERENAQGNLDEDSPDGITLSLEEYYELSKRAHDAEDQANTRVATAIAQVEAAKESELRSLNRLEVVSREVSNRREELEAAVQKADKAMEAKKAVEQELRRWRAEHELKCKAAKKSGGSRGSFGEAANDSRNKAAHEGSDRHQNSSQDVETTSSETEASLEAVIAYKKKKKSMIPRFFMFLGKKKSSHSSKT